MTLLKTLPLIALTGTLAAQTVSVAPIDHTDPTAMGEPWHIEGTASTSSYPFSRGISRVMLLYEVWSEGVQLLDLPAGAQITTLTFPADSTRISAGESLQMSINMGHSTKTIATMETTFDNNYAGPFENVFPTGIFALPPLNDPIAGMIPTVEVPLDVPFIYNGVDNLIVEFQITANSNGNQPFTYWLDVGTDVSPTDTFGMGCQTSGGSTPTLTNSNTAIGETWRSTLRFAPANALSVIHIGFAALPGPLAIPGAPGCTLDVNPAVALQGMTNGSGNVSWDIPVLDDIDNWQLSIYTQALAVDLFANPLGLVSSNGARLTLGIDPRIARLAQVGDAMAVSGSIHREWGQVTYFTHM